MNVAPPKSSSSSLSSSSDMYCVWSDCSSLAPPPFLSLGTEELPVDARAS